MSFTLNDKNLMAHFTKSIYFPLLNHIPKEWMMDFEDILLKFDSSTHVCIAWSDGKTFGINIDLDRMEKVTRGQFGEIAKPQNLVVQYFGNLAYAVVRAFYRYNKEKHPQAVEGLDADKVTIEFMSQILENAQKRLKETSKYIV